MFPGVLRLQDGLKSWVAQQLEDEKKFDVVVDKCAG